MAPDLDRARTLIEDAGATAERVTVWVSGEDLHGGIEAMRYVVEIMDDLGLRANLEIVKELDEYGAKVYAGDTQAPTCSDGSRPIRARATSSRLTSCVTLRPTPRACATSGSMLRSRRRSAQGTDPAAANSAWIEIEHHLVEGPVSATLANPVSTYAFSERTENIQDHPQWGILLSRLWVQ